jgi:hypothetical protein
LAILSLVAPGALAERPFATQEAETIEPGLFSIDVGIGYRDSPRDFGVEDRDWQAAIGATRLSFGVGRYVELQVSGTPLIVLEQEGETDTNSGDWIFGTKVWFLQEKPEQPSISFLYEVKLPNGSDEDGGATDETDFFGYFLFTKGARKDVFHGNVGLGILGNPFSNSAQNDVYLIRAAWERKISADRLFGVEGLFQEGPKEGDDPFFLRAVYAHRIGKWVVHGGVSAGLSGDADDWNVEAGFRRRFKLWPPAEAERRNTW